MTGQPKKRKAVVPGALLASIRENQNDELKRVNDIVRKVRGVYIPTDNDAQVMEEIENLLNDIELELNPFGDGTSSPVAIRGGRVLVVTGEAGAGKTRALGKAFLARPEFKGFGIDGEACPLLSLVAPSPFTLKALGNDAVRQLGYLTDREIPAEEVWPMLRILMQELGIQILHIDEAQHGDEISNPDMHQNVENTLKRLLQDVEWPLWLILSGLPELANFCQDDRSVARRIHHVSFASLSFPEDVEKVRSAIAQIVEPCGGLDCSGVVGDEFVNRLMHASLDQFGILVEYVQDAIQECLMSKSPRLAVEHFADAYLARTGEQRDAFNVFLAPKWSEITVETALFEEVVDDEGNPVGRRLKKGGKGRKK